MRGIFYEIKGVYISVARKKKSESTTTLTLIEKLQTLPVISTEVEFMDEKFSVLHTIPISTINIITKLVTANVFTYDEEGTLQFNPLHKDVVWDYCKVRYFTTIPLPENADANEIYDLAHRTGLIDLINSTLPASTLEYVESKITEAIEAKKYMISQETNILNVLLTLVKNMPTSEAISQMAEQVKSFDFGKLKILKQE